jgi:hypothetical protein
MDALIVGSGAVGRWVGARFDGPVAFADADRETAERAAAEVSRGSVARRTTWSLLRFQCELHRQ